MMNKKMMIINIVIWSIVLLVGISGFMYFVVNKEINMFEEDGNLEILKSETVSGDITDISIDWIIGGIKIFKTDKAEIEILQKAPTNFSENKLFSLDKTNSMLSISDENKNRFGINFGIPKRTYLEIYLPQKEYNKLEIAQVSGTTNIEFIKSKKLNIKTTSGKVILSGEVQESTFKTVSGKLDCNNFKTDKLEAKITSGNANFSGEFKDVELKTTSGDVSITSTTMLNSFESNVVSGDTKLYLPENDGFTLELKKVSGSFKSDFGTTNTDETYIYKNGNSKFSAKVTSGSLSILKNN